MSVSINFKLILAIATCKKLLLKVHCLV